MNFIRFVGAKTLGFIQSLGSITLFFLHILAKSGTAFTRPRLSIRQVYFAGVLSVLIVAVSGLFVGMVLGLQGYTQLAKFKSADILGYMVAASLLRELGPVVAALLFAGRACTSLTAGIGLMKSGEQLIAMEMMGVDPMDRVLAPRFVAVLIGLPMLALLFSAVGIVGAWIVGVIMIGVDPGSFWSQMQAGVSLTTDVINGVVVKSFVFALLCGFIALVVGHESEATPEGVARATTTTVVISSLAVLASDVLMTALMFGDL